MKRHGRTLHVYWQAKEVSLENFTMQFQLSNIMEEIKLSIIKKLEITMDKR